jgi:hypothetical protein
MRVFVVTALLIAGFAGPAVAYENFIPLGTGYSTEVDSLPSFGSERAEISARADVYETELYFIDRKAKEDDSLFRRFQSDSEVSGGDTSIDY